MLDMGFLVRQSLLMTEGQPARRPNVEPGRGFLQANKPSAPRLHKDLGLSLMVLKKRSTTGARINGRIQQSGLAIPTKERQRLRDLRKTLGHTVQRHAGRVLGDLRFKDVPKDTPAYDSPAPENRPRLSSFPPSAPKDAGVIRGKKGGRGGWKQFKATQRHMGRVLHYLRRTGHAVGGEHHEPSARAGIFHMNFGKHAHIAHAYREHLQREVPHAAQAITQDEDEDGHHLTVDHDKLHDAIHRHLWSQGIREMVRAPLLGLLTSAGS